MKERSSYVNEAHITMCVTPVGKAEGIPTRTRTDHSKVIMSRQAHQV
jgi:hypothetical protein